MKVVIYMKIKFKDDNGVTRSVDSRVSFVNYLYRNGYCKNINEMKPMTTSNLMKMVDFEWIKKVIK